MKMETVRFSNHCIRYQNIHGLTFHKILISTHAKHNNTTQHNTTQHNTTQHNTHKTHPKATYKNAICIQEESIGISFLGPVGLTCI